MAKPVVIFGTGDFARVASVYLTQDSAHEVAAFTVHQSHMSETMLLDRPVVPFEQLHETYPPERFAMFVAIGFRRINRARAEVYRECKAQGYELISYVCSKAMRWGHVEIGDNCFIFEANVIQPFVRIGNNVVIWSGNHIGHDAVIGDHCFIASHAVISGHVQVGEYSFVGVNATLRDGVTIGAQSVIGAAAVVLKDLPPQSVLRGNASEVSAVPSTRLKAI